MKTSVEIRRNTGRMIAKNLIVLAVIAVVAFIGVMSWFTQNQKATADGIAVQTEVGQGLEFYIMPPSNSDQYAAINSRLAENANWNRQNPNATQKRTTWHTNEDGSVSFDFTDQEFKFMEGLFLCEVTSDGKTFQIPKLLQYDKVAFIDEDQSFDAAVANDEYLSFDVYFRSETTQNDHAVSLKSDSNISPGTNDIKNDGDFTNFSENSNANLKDAAIGAVRMSILNMEDNEGSREMLWIPAPYVYYNGLTDTLSTGLDDNEYTNKGAVYYNGSALALRQNEGTNDHAYYASPKSRQVIRSNATNMVVGALTSNKEGIVTLSNDGGDGYYYGHIRVNLWIEGEDAEARLAFVGGKFSFSMNYELDVE